MKKKLILATNNKNKIKEISYILSDLNFHSPKNVDDALEIDRITRLKVMDYIKGL